jgi:serpin B
LGEIKEIFGTEVEEIDFNNSDYVVGVINDFVNKTTKGEIKEIIDNVEPETTIIVVNAIYFKSDWANKFTEVKKGKFRESAIDMMYLKCNEIGNLYDYRNIEDKKVTCVSLPYVGDRLKFNIFMHEDGDNEAILNSNFDFAQDINGQNDFVLNFPKFKVESKFEMIPGHYPEGLGSIFLGADFRHINEEAYNAGIQNSVSKVIHKAVATIDENGSTMAAATAVTMVFCCTAMPKVPPVITIDKPFIFVVKDQQTNRILFAGSIENL